LFFRLFVFRQQGCVMAVGGIKQRVVFDECTQTFKIRHTIKVTLSYDGRSITDQHAAMWLECFSRYLSDPQTMGL
jgi:pyruvate/2-oxoglutarate dehydrogenase complex dihydrolipoamide acyltransferase (E2) component